MGATCGFLDYIWRFSRTARPRLLDRLAEYEDTTTIWRLSTPGQVRGFASRLAP